MREETSSGDAVLDFVSQLPQKYKHYLPDPLNQVNQPPFFGHSRKIKESTASWIKDICKRKTNRMRSFVESIIYERAIGFMMSSYDQKMLKNKKEVVSL